MNGYDKIQNSLERIIDEYNVACSYCNKIQQVLDIATLYSLESDTKELEKEYEKWKGRKDAYYMSMTIIIKVVKGEKIGK